MTTIIQRRNFSQAFQKRLTKVENNFTFWSRQWKYDKSNKIVLREYQRAKEEVRLEYLFRYSSIHAGLKVVDTFAKYPRNEFELREVF